MKWTLVQHTAFSIGRNRAFKDRAEPRAVRTDAEERLVRLFGGKLFDTYEQAKSRASLVRGGTFVAGLRGEGIWNG
jgi:hypothetical protein